MSELGEPVDTSVALLTVFPFILWLRDNGYSLNFKLHVRFDFLQVKLIHFFDKKIFIYHLKNRKAS